MLREDEKLSQLETVMAFFAPFVLDSVLVQEIMRWDMVVLSESPWYQQILKEGEQRGRQVGEQIGEQRGEKRGIVSAIELSLEIKFGDEGLQLMPKISQITDLEQLKNIQREIMTANNIAELREFMQGI